MHPASTGDKKLEMPVHRHESQYTSASGQAKITDLHPGWDNISGSAMIDSRLRKGVIDA